MAKPPTRKGGGGQPPKKPARAARKPTSRQRARAGGKPPADPAVPPGADWRPFDAASPDQVRPKAKAKAKAGGAVIDLASHKLAKGRGISKAKPADPPADPPADTAKAPTGDPIRDFMRAAFDRPAIIERLVAEGIDRGRATQYADLFLEYAEGTIHIRMMGVVAGKFLNPWVERRDRVRKALLDFRNIEADWLWSELAVPGEA